MQWKVALLEQREKIKTIIFIIICLNSQNQLSFLLEVSVFPFSNLEKQLDCDNGQIFQASLLNCNLRLVTDMMRVELCVSPCRVPAASRSGPSSSLAGCLAGPPVHDCLPAATTHLLTLLPT